jgi:hypothetical protein
MVVLVFVMAGAYGQTSNLIGNIGDFGRESGSRGAEVNRQLADQLYQQALANERAAWSGKTPNVSLLSKALQQSKDAKAADDQAKEFARAALHASNSGAHSGDFINSRYGMTDESRLKELSSTSSPYMPQAENTLGGYGLKLSADKMSLQTPFGKFSVNTDNSTLLKMAGSIAAKMGYKAADVETGQKEAIQEREALAQKIAQAVDQQLNVQKANAEEAAATGRQLASLKPADPNVSGNAGADRDSGVIGSEAGAPAVKNFEMSAADPDWNATEKALLANRKAMGREMGMESAADPLGRKTQDIFRMIHLRYQSLHSEGAFLTK